jgi:hypothetical protein
MIQHWVAIMRKELTEGETALFSDWFTRVPPRVDVWQPLVESWLDVVDRYEGGLLSDVGTAPPPVDHVAALVHRVTNRPSWDDVKVDSEWDRAIARAYGTAEGDAADLIQHFDVLVATVGYRYIWSWAAERFANQIEWSSVAAWGLPYLPPNIAGRSRTIDLVEVLPLPAGIYRALKVAVGAAGSGSTL